MFLQNIFCACRSKNIGKWKKEKGVCFDKEKKKGRKERAVQMRP